jgi:hypothetical protein
MNVMCAVLLKAILVILHVMVWLFCRLILKIFFTQKILSSENTIKNIELSCTKCKLSLSFLCLLK